MIFPISAASEVYSQLLRNAHLDYFYPKDSIQNILGRFIEFSVDTTLDKVMNPSKKLFVDFSRNHFSSQVVVRNNLEANEWGNEEREGKIPFEKGMGFDLAITNEAHSFQVPPKKLLHS